jgi:hypothetical protein
MLMGHRPHLSGGRWLLHQLALKRFLQVENMLCCAEKAVIVG